MKFRKKTSGNKSEGKQKLKVPKGSELNMKKVNSISFRVIIGITLMTSVLLCGLGITIFKQVKFVNEIQFTERLSNTQHLMDEVLYSYFVGLDKTVNLLANAGNEDSDLVYDLAGKIKASNEHIVDAGVVYFDGEIVSYPENSITETEKGLWYERALENDAGITYFSPLYKKDDGSVVVAGVQTIYDENGSVLGVAVLEVGAEIFVNLFGDETSMGDIKFILIDENCNVLLNPYSVNIDFKNCDELGIEALKGYIPGSYGISKEKIFGKDWSEVRKVSSENDLYNVDYAIIIPLSVINASTNAVLTIVAVVLAIGFIFSVAMAFLIAHSITKRLLQVTFLLKNISQGDGDLTVQIPVTPKDKDELGLLSGYFNLTIKKIANSMKKIILQMTNMHSQSDSLSEIMNESAAAMEQVNGNINSVQMQIKNQAKGVEQTSESVTDIADNITKLNSNVEKQARSVEMSSSSVEEMVANINSVTGILEKNAENVRQLAESAETGRQIVKETVTTTSEIAEESAALIETSNIIRNLASQTNMLAMNAAIEAAHAGTAGAGFAVVADEIRNLAEDSNNQGKKIGDVMKHLREMIVSLTEGAQKMEKQFNVIFEHTQTVNHQESVIKSAMDEQSAGSKQVIDAIHQINSITNDVRDSAAIMEQGSNRILSEMTKLSSITTEINGAMEEITSGVSGLNNSMQNVNRLTKENVKSVKGVAVELSKFKVDADSEAKS